MSKKFVVSIMDKHTLGDGFYVFNCSHTAVGEIDEHEIFTDHDGKEFGPMLKESLLESENPQAYSNILELRELPSRVGKELTYREALEKFNTICKKVIYFVGKTDEGEVFCVSFNTDVLKGNAEEAKRGKDSEKEEEEEDMSPTLKKLITDVRDGKYTLEQLKGIFKNLAKNGEELDEALNVLKLQIEASEKGESATELPEEKPKEEETEKMTQEEAEAYIAEWQRKNWIQNHRIDIEDLYQKVTRTLIAQDEPARRVITEIARKDMDIRKKKQGLLLTGQTGVGKTKLMSLIAKYLDRPFMKVDSTLITVPGYVGKDIEEVLWDLYIKCGKDVHEAQRAIIFFDEIDKKGSAKKTDVSGQGVINVLLPFIEGSVYDATPNVQKATEKVAIDTENMIVIFGGAFTDVYKNLVVNNQIGFGSNVASKSKPVYRTATTQDFIENGMMTDEFMGRVTVVKLNDLDVGDIKRILLESDESAMKVQAELFERLGVKVTFTDSFVDGLATKAFKRKSGARGLNAEIDESTWKAFAEAYASPDTYEEIIFGEQSVDDPDAYQLVKRREEI